MNKQYLDFVPSKRPTTSPRPRGANVSRTMPKKVSSSVAVASRQSRVATAPNTKPAIRQTARPSTGVGFESHTSKGVELGVIEDLSSKFIKTNTDKRPLNSGKPAAAQTQPKTQAVEKKGRASDSKNKKSSDKKSKVKNSGASSEYKTPKSPFINLDKVTKRPLSKNVYKKEVAAPKEVPKGPVTIINKPEKESHIGLIITIIITIILGAAAGTVAFLLLPK